MPEDSPSTALLEPKDAAAVERAASPADSSRSGATSARDGVPPEYRRLRVWWWLAFTPLAVLIGGIGGLLVRTHRVELAHTAAPIPPAASATPVAKSGRPLAAIESARTPVATEPRPPIATPAPTKPVAATFLPKEKPAVPAAATPAPATPAPAVTTTAPASMATPAPSADIGKWLATMDAQWRASYQRDVMGPFEKGVVELRRQHFVALGNPLAAAKKAGNDAEVAAINAERDLVSKGNNPPATDEDSTPGALKLARTNFRSQFVRLDKERFERARALFAKCDELLTKSQATLTQRQLTEDVASVQKERDQLREAWLQPPAALATALPPMSKPVAAPAKITSQQIVARLMELNAAVWAKRGGKPENVEIKSETELGADEKVIFTRVEFRARKRDESPLVLADYAILDSLTEVPELMLSGTTVKDAVMEKLRSFRGLKNLSLNQAKPSPAGYAVLATLPELHDLSLYDTDANDEAMKSIVQCKKLQRLHLSNLPLTDAAFAEIGKLGALEELSLSGLNKLNSPAFAHFAECRSLKRVYLGGFLVLSGMVENLGKCKDLETIGMPAAGLKDADVAPLGGLPKLKALDLSGSSVTGSAFTTWPQRQALLSLNLSNTPGVDDAACKNIEHTFPKLEDLRIKLLPGFSIEGATYLTRLRTLRNLHIEGEGVTDEMVAEFAHRDTIATLGIPLAKLTDTGVAALARMPHLADLSLDMPPITEAAMKSFARCKELKTLHIGKDADPDTEAKFLRNAPGVKVIRPEG